MEHFRSNNEHSLNVMNIQISDPKKVYSLDSWFYSCSFIKFFNKVYMVTIKKNDFHGWGWKEKTKSLFSDYEIPVQVRAQL